MSVETGVQTSSLTTASHSSHDLSLKCLSHSFDRVNLRIQIFIINSEERTKKSKGTCFHGRDSR